MKTGIKLRIKDGVLRAKIVYKEPKSTMLRISFRQFDVGEEQFTPEELYAWVSSVYDDYKDMSAGRGDRLYPDDGVNNTLAISSDRLARLHAEWRTSKK